MTPLQKLIEFYDQIKDSSWADCRDEDDFKDLPKEILTEMLFRSYKLYDHIDPTPLSQDHAVVNKLSETEVDFICNNREYYYQTPKLSFTKQFNTNDIKIYYDSSLDGGGIAFGLRYQAVIRKIYGDKKFNSCFEWCSGPGFIGFDLLSSGVCDQLYLADIYPPALEAIEKTVNNLPDHYQGRVQWAKIQGIQDLPADWRFDLVVSNPPHWNPETGAMITNLYYRDRICTDMRWEVHQEFFTNISRYLADDGVILLQEHSYGSGPEMFKPYIEQAGLVITDCYWEPINTSHYYLEVKKK